MPPPIESPTLKMPQPDQVIVGRYRIISRIGSGGMGLVFQAEQLGVGNKVALKFLDPEPTGDDSRIARFLREAKVGLQVQHPGAAQILDMGRDESMRLFLCFELVDGEDLRAVIRREGRLSFAEARSIAVQVAQVLAFAHERNIVHRDVKPENIRIRRDLGSTHVKVLDFGIARLLKDAGVRLTGEGMLTGTPRYMSPEQVRDEAIDGRVDQYATGLLLFEMLTGTPAIGGNNVAQILRNQLRLPVPSLASVDPQLDSPHTDAFIAKACAKSAESRYPTMADFIVALQNLEVDEKAWPVPKQPQAEAISAAPTRLAQLEMPPGPERLLTSLPPMERPADPERPAVPRPPDASLATTLPDRKGVSWKIAALALALALGIGIFAGLALR